MKRLSLAFFVLLLFLFWIVVKPDTSNSQGKGMTHTFRYGNGDAVRLQQGIERLRIFEAELRNEGFRQVSVAHTGLEKREVKLKGRYRRLGEVTVTLWTDTRLDREEPQIGAGFDANIRNDAAEAAWEEFNDRFRRAVQGDVP